MSTLFVDFSSVGSNDGSSWDTAYQSLSAALSNAQTGDEIWVAKGIYLPGSDRSDAFRINAGVTIYGGFDGTESALAERDWQTNLTVLSGDIGTADDNSDNSYQVVVSDTSEMAELNGVIIQGGNTEGSSGSDDGGGVYNRQNLTIRNTVVRDNRSIDDGGGIRNDGDLLVVNSAIANNSAAGASGTNSLVNTSGGGGLLNTTSATATIFNTTFSDNQALNGGAIRNDGELSLANTTLSGNSATQSGGGILNTIDGGESASLTLTNSTVTQNSALVGAGILNFGAVAAANSIVADNGGTDLTNNSAFGGGTSRSDGYNLIGNGSSTGFTNGVNNDQVGTSANPIDPLLGDLQNNGGFTQTHLPNANSSVIDSGSNSLLPADSDDLDSDGDTDETLSTDQRGAGFARVIDGTVDIGAVEAGATMPPVANEPPSIAIEPVVTSLSESADTSQAIKLADVIVTDGDEVGLNTLSIISRYAELLDAASAEIIGIVSSVALDVFGLETLASLDSGLFEAIAAEFVETAGNSFSDRVLAEIFDRLDDTSETITLDSLIDLATEFLNSVDADLFAEAVDRFLLAMDDGTFSALAVDFLEGLSEADFEAIAAGFLDKLDTDFFESLVTDFLEESGSSTADAIDSAAIQAALSELVATTDPSIFEIVEGELFLKAGTALDFETQSQYNITLQVDDMAVGSTPDASIGFRLQISDVNDNETGVLEVSASQLLNALVKQGMSGQLNVSIDIVNTSQLSEVVVVSTDETGRINGIAPEEEGYLDALIAESLSLLSTLEKGTFEGLDVTRQLALDTGSDTGSSDSFLQFGLITGGTLDSLQQSGIGKLQLGPSVASALEGLNDGILQAEPLGDGTVRLGFDTNGDSNFEDLVLTASLQAASEVIGAGLQGKGESELIDLRSVSGPVRADIVIYREAAFDNVLGFFTVENVEGQVRDQSGNLLSVGDAGYVKAAIASRVTPDLTGDNGAVKTYSAQLAGGQLLSSFIVSDGAIADLLDEDTANDPEVYFTHLGANSDGADHVRLLGDNTFGFEDTINGGDQDFDDLVVKVTFSV